MLALPRKFLFAVEAVVDIAYHAGGVPVRNGDITRRQKIPARYLEQLLQKLVRDGILTSTRGPKGGYLLARERRRITLGDIRRALAGEIDDGESRDLKLISASSIGRKILKPLWSNCEERLWLYMDEITIEELCSQARRASIASESPRANDFSI